MTLHRRTRQRIALIGDVMQSWEPLLWLVAAVLPVVIVAMRFDIGQNADGLVQTLMSLNHLTVFFWEQNRFANLVPLLTRGIADPTMNAQAQLAIRIVAGVAAPLLFTAPLVRDGDILRVGRIALLAADLALAFGPQRYLWEWFIEASPYGTSFALGGCALLAFDATRRLDGVRATALRCGGLLLTVAAYMVNMSLVLFTAPLFGLLAITRGSRLAIEFGLASAVGGIVTVIAANSVPVPHTTLRFGESFIGLTYYLWVFTQKPGYFLGAMFALFALSLGIGKALKRSSGDGLLGYGLMLLATFAFAFVAISLNSWVIANDLHPRYMVPLFILAASLGAISLVTVADATVTARNRSRIGLGLCLAMSFMAGQRSLSTVPQDGGIVTSTIRTTATAAADELIRLRLDGVAGSYWLVWPTIFLAEQKAYDLGRPRGQFFGASERGIARRGTLKARLLVEGHLDFACLDLLQEPCRALVSEVVGSPLSIGQPPSPPHPVGPAHRLSVLRLTSDDAGPPL